MTQEENSLLLKDLCARLPYKVKVCLYEKEICILMGIKGDKVYLDVDSDSFHIESIKPYLRPMSSMTEEEIKELQNIVKKRVLFSSIHLTWHLDGDVFDWLNAHHIDYRFLIENGLALKAPEGMYD